MINNLYQPVSSMKKKLARSEHHRFTLRQKSCALEMHKEYYPCRQLKGATLGTIHTMQTSFLLSSGQVFYVQRSGYPVLKVQL